MRAKKHRMVEKAQKMHPAGCPGLLGETGNGCILHGYFVPCTNTKLS